MLQRLTSFLMWAALAVAVLAYPAAYALDRAEGKDVVLLAGGAFDAAQVKQRRAEFDETEVMTPEKHRRAIVELYGPSSNADVLRVLFVPDAEIIRPAEDATIAILPQENGAHRIQAASAYFAAKIAVMAGVAAFVVLLVVRRLLK